jgi:hypothetical protein
MASTELRRRLTELAQRFVEDVLSAIEHAPLTEVAQALPRAPAPPRVAPTVSVQATKRKAPQRGQTALRETVAEPENGGRKYVRRSGDEIHRLRAIILEALRHAGRPIAASEIAQDVGVRTADLAFPMAQLRQQGLVEKNGLRTQAVYWLTESDEDERARKKKKKGRR